MIDLPLLSISIAKRTGSILILTCLFAWPVFAQISNDECIYATHIQDVEDYCSEPHQFSNEGASASAQINPSCWPQGSNSGDVWFSFVPKNLGVLIKLTGLSVEDLGTIQQPSLAVYSGDCNALTEEGCNSVFFGEHVIELTLSNLVIGRIYYIRVDARDMGVGDFQLCINSFSPVKSPESDCRDAVILCNKDEFFVEKIDGVGQDANEVNGTCIQQELASVWYKWTCKDAGTLTFTITPNNKTDDIDFALYEMPDGLDGCGTKRPIRCMASGETINNPAGLNSPCFGPTGLDLTSNDVQENPGCQSGDDNFIRFIDMEVGMSYALVINNFSQSGSGFSITWGGTGTFQGPDADFIAVPQEAFECDKTIDFFNLSSSQTDPIVSYLWNFGEGANPQVSNQTDSISVVYNSFGQKTAAIIVESSKGCTVTKIVDFYINPCCRDTTNLDVQGMGFDLLCADIENGTIIASGTAGNPRYQYSLDGENFQPNPNFNNLGAGDYTLYILDIKGCQDSTSVVIGTPPPLLADAGPDQEIELGETTFLNGSFTPPNSTTNFNWLGEGFIDSTGTLILNPEVLPPGDYTYTLEVVDENGCISTDEVTIRVRIVRPVYSPNIFTPDNRDGVNDFFSLFGGPAVDGIEELLVYDRWGNLMYKGTNIPINDYTVGWDGKFNGQYVNPGVYTWYARVSFIDKVTLPFAGDITVIR